MRRKILFKAKDGGPESPVDGYFLCEFKSLFSIVLLKFNEGGREAFHTHAFNAYTWFLKGEMEESVITSDLHWSYKRAYRRTLKPKYTSRHRLHRVFAKRTGWCLSIRGPWSDTWTEYSCKTGKITTFKHGRQIVNET